MIYVLTGNIEESDAIRRNRGYDTQDWVYIDTKLFNLKQRDGRGKTIYFCGTFYSRKDWQEIEHYAKERGFNIAKEMPPRKE